MERSARHRRDLTVLRATFRHLPGIGEKTERALWQAGIRDWRDLLDAESARGRFRSHREALAESEAALASEDVAHFGRRLPPSEWYRLAPTFPHRCVFLDIETTGLSRYYDEITVVGWSLGAEYAAIVGSSRIGELADVLAGNPILITFNGSLFDLPFIRSRLTSALPEHFHIDLRFLARRVGLAGGQKSIETRVGITRPKRLQGVDGADAVRLWYEYKEGRASALRTLLEYNHSDIEGMKRLLSIVLERLMRDGTAPGAGAVPRFRRSRLRLAGAASQSMAGDRAGDGAPILLSPFTGKVGPRCVLADLTGARPSLADLTVTGIDLSGGAGRPSGCAVVTGASVATRLLGDDAEILADVSRGRPHLVSIDSPLSLPAGRTTTSDDDPGRQRFGITRYAERILRRRGVNVYPALLPSMQRLTARGTGLAGELRRMGIPVIESYPGAAQDILGIPRKGASQEFLRRGLERFGYSGFRTGRISHDELDAVTSALVAQFLLAGRFELLGNTEEDYLVVPDLAQNAEYGCAELVAGISGPIAAGKTTAARILESAGFTYCRFSRFLADEIQRQGTPVTRESLQRSGAKTYESPFGQRRLQNTLARSVRYAPRIVIDGLRHPEDHAFLRERWGLAALHIHISAPRGIREQRYVDSDGHSSSEFSVADEHEAERDVPRLAALADAIIANDSAVTNLRKALLDAIGEGVCRSPL